MNGLKYDAALTPAQIAKKVRLDISLLQETDGLPEGAYAVRTKGDKIVIHVDVPDHITLEQNGRYQRYTDETRQFFESLESLITQYAGVVDDHWNIRARVEAIEGIVFKGG